MYCFFLKLKLFLSKAVAREGPAGTELEPHLANLQAKLTSSEELPFGRNDEFTLLNILFFDLLCYFQSEITSRWNQTTPFLLIYDPELCFAGANKIF